MQDAKSIAEIGTLALDEPSTSLDPGVRKVATPSDKNTCFRSNDRPCGVLSAGQNSEISLKQHDVIALRAELDWLDGIEHPWGPFPTYQRHLEYILSQYEAVSPQRHIRHASPMDSRKDSLT